MPVSPALVELIDKHGGPLPFEDFMRAALYDGDRGYYTTRIGGVGRRGDFVTAATLGSALGQAVAAWVERVAPEGPIIELGPGTGAMAERVLDALGDRVPLHLVEVSPRLRALQQERLAGRPVTWHADPASAVRACARRAAIFSNELVDAFPCTILQYESTGWAILALRSVSGRIEEVPIALDERTMRVPLSVMERTWPTGQRCEVHPSYAEWLGQWAPLLAEGHLLTIDYGDTVDRLYHRRPSGTVRGYLGHLLRQGAELYEGLGQQDLTADVNFTDLDRWGRDLGWATVELCSQGDFIERFAGDTVDASDPATRFVLDRDGMGGAVQVLWQSVA